MARFLNHTSTSVPEPLTVIVTVLGSGAALAMRKRSKAMNKI
ncbi:PEP-CTERM sorting domain-containing protein [Chamaesiphon sp. VAR_69_metabat_338]